MTPEEQKAYELRVREVTDKFYRQATAIAEESKRQMDVLHRRMVISGVLYVVVLLLVIVGFAFCIPR